MTLISQADAIKAVESANPKDKEYHYYKHIAVEALKALPSADAVQGEWIRVGHDIYECSLCHQNVMTKDIDCYSYCHQCGARMQNSFKSVGQAWNTEQRR